MLQWLDRISAWASAILVFVLVISGFGLLKPEVVQRMTLGLLDWERSQLIHRHLVIPLCLTASIHGFFCTRRRLRALHLGWVGDVLSALAIGTVLTYLVLAAFQ